MSLILIPIISGLIGWVTNFIAVKMLFHPKQPINIFGYKIQGLIPKRKNELAQRIGNIVQKELVSHQQIMELLNDPIAQKGMQVIIEKKIEEFLATKLSEINPMISIFMVGPILDKTKQILMTEIVYLLPVLIEQLTNNLEDKINFQTIVQNKIEAFDLDELETIVYKIADTELKHIEYSGAVLGFIIGLIQVVLVKVF